LGHRRFVEACAIGFAQPAKKLAAQVDVEQATADHVDPLVLVEAEGEGRIHGLGMGHRRHYAKAPPNARSIAGGGLASAKRRPSVTRSTTVLSSAVRSSAFTPSRASRCA